eukprot:scaffold65496_cov26-Tisochrysis_lutea.AAC.1
MSHASLSAPAHANALPWPFHSAIATVDTLSGRQPAGGRSITAHSTSNPSAQAPVSQLERACGTEAESGVEPSEGEGGETSVMARAHRALGRSLVAREDGRGDGEAEGELQHED